MTIADRKAREKEQRRNDIINAAEKLFFSKGYDNVSMEDIAKKVELNRATLYLYFKNKEALFFAIVLRAVRQLHFITNERMNNSMNSYQRVIAAGHSYLTFANVYPDYYKVYQYFQTGRFDDLADEEVNEDLREIKKLQKEMVGSWVQAIKSGITEGTIGSEIDPLYASVLIMSTIESLANMRPALKEVLESEGVDMHSFIWADFNSFVYGLIGIKKLRRRFDD